MFEWMLDVCKGMNHLHSEGLVHRDLAARNLLLTKDLRIKVLQKTNTYLNNERTTKNTHKQTKQTNKQIQMNQQMNNE
jgi:serine/threonine protein kinase